MGSLLRTYYVHGTVCHWLIKFHPDHKPEESWGEKILWLNVYLHYHPQLILPKLPFIFFRRVRNFFLIAHLSIFAPSFRKVMDENQKKWKKNYIFFHCIHFLWVSTEYRDRQPDFKLQLHGIDQVPSYHFALVSSSATWMGL